jgi:hypothetical protein
MFKLYYLIVGIEVKVKYLITPILFVFRVVLKFLKCLSESITTLGLPSNTGAAEINWEEILTKMVRNCILNELHY